MSKKGNVADITKLLLELIGEDPQRDGLRGTPKRVEKFYNEILSGYKQKEEEIFKTFDYDYIGNDGLIALTEIPFYSLCEHHLVPFFGKVDIGYIPQKKILGLSKFTRLVDLYAKRLQVQERLTSQVSNTIMKYLKPKGAIVLSRAEHLCMSMRGVKKPGSITKVIAKEGLFNEDQKLVSDFFNLIK